MKKFSLLLFFFAFYTVTTISQENFAIKKAVEDIAIEDNSDNKLHNLNDLKGVHALYFEFYLTELTYGTMLVRTIYDNLEDSNNNYFVNKIFSYYERFINHLNDDLKNKFLMYNGTIYCSDEGITHVTLYFADENNYGFEVNWTRLTNGMTYTYNSDNYKKEKIVFKSDLKKIKNARRNLKKSKNK